MITRRASSIRVVLAGATIACLAAGCAKNAAPPATTTTAGSAASTDPHGHPPAPEPATAPASATFLAADLPLLPNSVVNSVAPLGVTRAVYEFAARHPEVLQHMPCFCGCERGGHKGNHDCFVASRDKATNKVTAWDSHGIICEICIDVGYQALQMHTAGASVAEIRNAVDKRYAGAPTRTPTPNPPARGSGH
jgi:hypothetical protein